MHYHGAVFDYQRQEGESSCLFVYCYRMIVLVVGHALVVNLVYVVVAGGCLCLDHSY